MSVRNVSEVINLVYNKDDDIVLNKNGMVSDNKLRQVAKTFTSTLNDFDNDRNRERVLPLYALAHLTERLKVAYIKAAYKKTFPILQKFLRLSVLESFGAFGLWLMSAISTFTPQQQKSIKKAEKIHNQFHHFKKNNDLSLRKGEKKLYTWNKSEIDIRLNNGNPRVL